MTKLLLTFYGDDFTGSTDALEQLALAGVRTMLFIRPPTLTQLKQFPGLQALGVAGKTRSLAPAAMKRELRPALLALKRLSPRHVHYKVCSTFDSSPELGSIGRAIDVGTTIFRAPFVPVLAAAPALGRYTVFGTHFARYGIGSAGTIHRLDRHPAISKHPVTPMTEADLRVHLAKQTRKRIALFDILKVSLPGNAARAALTSLLGEQPEVVVFDALTPQHLATIGRLLDGIADQQRPLFSVGSSGIEAALASCRAGVSPVSGFSGRRWSQARRLSHEQVVVGSGSCSPVTCGQIGWALANGFGEVALDVPKLLKSSTAAKEIQRAANDAVCLLQAGRSVIVHTTKHGPASEISARLKGQTAKVLGTAIGNVLRMVAARSFVRRLCVAGGDTSSYAARALGIEALEMIAPLTPGAPLCRAHATGSPVDQCEVVFKGGQVGPENYFAILRKGKP